MKRFLSTTMLAGLLITFMACNSSDQKTPGTSETQPVASTEAQPAKVTLVKYSDYQCPACEYYWQYEKQLKEDFGEDLKIQTKHFPLSGHAYAHVASRAAEAARKQGKYEEFHAKLFEEQSVWSQGNAEALFIGYAEEFGMDVETFKSDMNSAAMNRIVMSDRREGRDLGVNSTPTYFINGDKVENMPDNYEQFKNLIQQYMD